MRSRIGIIDASCEKAFKDLQGKKRIWEKHMIARRRKTIAVCHDCHWKIHTGKLD